MDVVVGVLLVVTGVVTVAYWLDFFIRGSVQAVSADWYLRFERAFPAADGWMALCSLVAALGLFTESAYGTVFALLAAGALIFLGLMDLTFNLQNGLFRLLPGSGQMWVEVVIIAWCLAFGVFLAFYFGTRVV
ncbi:hypothetical protein SAMN05216199_3011 [Pedococcus cremeus]|uniref:Uncharacterized protein n=1 Tax=Pedococcus cremeus TaxID=587636 RepID=A0A1H9WLL1_9MICO|nr:hypothetical protein SAMN05216199_3011 [Pedococcus cremeus]